MDTNALRSYLCCTVCAIAITLIGTGLRAVAQTPSTELTFEVATVKPVIVDASHPFNPRHFWAHTYETRASYWSMSPDSLITYAYEIDPIQVTGPEWADAERFDIDATFPEGAGKQDERKMLQALLKDRFKLTLHIEKKDLEVNVLAVGKRGEKLKPSPPDPVAETGAPKPEENNAKDGTAKAKVITTQDGVSKINMGKRGTFSVKFDFEHWANHIEQSKMTMAELARRLGGCLGSGAHKVVDETGIMGTYQVAYDCPLPNPPRTSGTGSAGTLPADPQDGSLLLRSLDALGLKLEKRKITMDVYVIDHVEAPSAN